MADGQADVVELVEIAGVVQGVGFRPFVCRLATELELSGSVANCSGTVRIEVSGSPAALDSFAGRLLAEAPPLARIDSVVREATEASVAEKRGFSIVESQVSQASDRALLPPDTAVCDDCIAELFDPSNRRFHHPFISCTNCGPRFTIVTSVPYDRQRTTLASFAMCGECAREYTDPNDRRFHAQPIGCHECGPRLSDIDIGDAAWRLTAGEVIAVKGLGGYHLACDAQNSSAVDRLRTRKHRPDKPFAVMVPSLAEARKLARISSSEAALLSSPQAPIVLVEAIKSGQISELVAPGNPWLGIMLAYTPVHHLLFAEGIGPLVMTSANRSGEPLAFDDEGLRDIANLFDAVLDHNRPINSPCDDSVIRSLDTNALPLRRARGFAPTAVPLPGIRRPVLAVGGDFKNTVCLAADGQAWMSQHLGDLETLRSMESFSSAARQLSVMRNKDPQAVATDAHPTFRSADWARSTYPGATIAVQHHHAHVASVMAEHQLAPNQPILGFAFDGTGFGDDGTIWGGEFLLASAQEMTRLGHLAPVPLPGGDAASHHPGRVALAFLAEFELPWKRTLAPVTETPDAELQLLRRQLQRGFNCHPSSSMGRLFDAVAALLGLRQKTSYEAQAAIDLEALASRWNPSTVHQQPYRFDEVEGVVDPTPVLAAIVDDVSARLDTASIAWRFHDAVAEIVQRLAQQHRGLVETADVALSGGVFQNVLLTTLCTNRLEAAGFTPRTHTVVPPNDGGLALGQAFVAAHRLEN